MPHGHVYARSYVDVCLLKHNHMTQKYQLVLKRARQVHFCCTGVTVQLQLAVIMSKKVVQLG